MYTDSKFHIFAVQLTTQAHHAGGCYCDQIIFLEYISNTLFF